MSKILIKTSFGYYKDQQGHITAKAQLPAGPHDLADGLIYVEVDNQADLDKIEVWQEPQTQEQAISEIKIQTKLREMAITELIKEGQWPAVL